MPPTLAERIGQPPPHDSIYRATTTCPQPVPSTLADRLSQQPHRFDNPHHHLAPPALAEQLHQRPPHVTLLTPPSPPSRATTPLSLPPSMARLIPPSTHGTLTGPHPHFTLTCRQTPSHSRALEGGWTTKRLEMSLESFWTNFIVFSFYIHILNSHLFIT